MSKLRKSMGLLLPAMRISVALTLLSACILLSADMLGLTLDEDRQALDVRKRLSESLAIQFSLMEPERDLEKIEGLIRLIALRNPEILSTGIRRSSGQLVFKSEDHLELWKSSGIEKSTPSHVLVPLLQGENLWGNVELRFAALKSDSLYGFTQKAIFELMLFVLLSGFFVYLAFMLRTLRQLDPSAVIPDRE